MHDVLRMEELQPVGDLICELEKFGSIERFAAHARRDCLAVEPFHDKNERVAGDGDLLDVDERRVIDRAGEPDVADERLAARGILRQLPRQQLDRHLLLVAGVLRLPDRRADALP